VIAINIFLYDYYHYFTITGNYVINKLMQYTGRFEWDSIVRMATLHSVGHQPEDVGLRYTRLHSNIQASIASIQLQLLMWKTTNMTKHIFKCKKVQTTNWHQKPTEIRSKSKPQQFNMKITVSQQKQPATEKKDKNKTNRLHIQMRDNTLHSSVVSESGFKSQLHQH